MSVSVVPTRSGDAVTTHAYDLLFDMRGPEGPETYRLDFKFNRRMDRWLLSIFDSRERVVVRGAVVLMLVDLLSYAVPGLRPRGSLVCVWKSNADTAPEPGEKDLGAWAEIIYFERIEDLDDTPPVEPVKA